MLAVVLATTYGGGVSPSAIGAKVVSPIATYADGVFSSTHWRRYQTYTQATCTVWWCFFGGGGGGRYMCMWWWWLYLMSGSGG